MAGLFQEQRGFGLTASTPVLDVSAPPYTGVEWLPLWRRRTIHRPCCPQCPIHRPPHGLHGPTVLDDETMEWLLNTCPKI